MLPRAARALRQQAHTCPLPRQAPPAYLRTFARDGRPPRPAPGGKTPPRAATGSARQTSPGNAVPRDQTWKPKDSIKFGGPAAATPTPAAAAAPAAGTTTAQETANEEFQGFQSPAVNTEPRGQPGPTPGPSDTAAPTSSPVTEHEKVTEHAQANEEFQGQEVPSQPLPDLRQGIPSTFGEEFGFPQGREAPSKEQVSRDEGGVAMAEPSTRSRRRDEDSFEQSDYETSYDRRRARLANYMYLGIVISALGGATYLTRPYGDDEEVPAGLSPSDISSWTPGAAYARVKSRWSGSVEYYTEPTFQKLLPEIPEAQRPPFTLVLSLEDLMIHSGWSREHGWRTAKRPGVDYFIRYLSQYYELVVFTSVPMAMADPIIKKLDPFHIIMWPLFREATRYEKGQYVKDLAYLNRPLDKVIMIDTEAEHVKNQPENAIILPKWRGDAKDPHARDLVALIPFLEYIATMGVQDSRKVLESFAGKDIPTEFALREAKARADFQTEFASERSRRPKKSLGGLFNSALGIKPQPGGLSLGGDETSVADGLAQGKMLSDQIRERGQRAYEQLERDIQTNGAKWLKEMEEEEKKLMESASKDMRNNWLAGFGSGTGASVGSETEKRQ